MKTINLIIKLTVSDDSLIALKEKTNELLDDFVNQLNDEFSRINIQASVNEEIITQTTDKVGPNFKKVID